VALKINGEVVLAVFEVCEDEDGVQEETARTRVCST
jgi:hypothetical protein